MSTGGFSSALMLDPSTLLSWEGPDLVAENFGRGVEVVISHHFGRWLDGELDLELREMLAPEDLEIAEGARERLRESGVAERLRRFHYGDARLNRPAAAVLRELMDSGYNAPVWADEWAYLQSNSWLGSKSRRALDAFRDAGAAIVEFGKKTGLNMIYDVIPREHVPESIDGDVIGRAALKWLIAGGAAAGGGTLAGIAGAGVGGPLGAVAAGKAGAYVAGRVTRAAVLAIDP